MHWRTFQLIVILIFAWDTYGQCTLEVNAFISEDSVCVGDTVLLDVLICGALSDDFDPDIDISQWTTIMGVSADNLCATISGNALRFGGSALRKAITKQIDVASGGTIEFYLKHGTTSNPCERPELGDSLMLMYSIDSGANWIRLITYLTGGYDNYVKITESIPVAAQSLYTQFRFFQPFHTGLLDNWMIDDLEIRCSGSSGSETYSWSPGKDIDDSTVASTFLIASATGSYIVEVVDSSCTAADTVYLWVEDFQVDIVPDTPGICQEDSVTLSAVPNLPAADYVWTPFLNISDPNIASPSVFPGSNTTYSVTVTSFRGCEAMESVLVEVDSLPISDFSVMVTGNTVDFTNESLHADSYEWDFGDGDTSTTPSPTHVYQPGAHTATLIASGKCGTDTLSQVITITGSGSSVSKNPVTFKLYPNPSDHLIHVEVEQGGNHYVRILNILWEVVLSASFDGNQITIDLNRFGDGIYYLLIATGHVQYFQKFVLLSQ